MGMVEEVRENGRERLLGVAAALVVVGGRAWVLFTRPTLGFFALIGAGLVGAVASYLAVQKR
jgi:energy-converting hydrogenase Eha subunit C